MQQATRDPAARLKLTERFLVPPFSVLDARQGYWQERKEMWLGLGIQSELGRGGNLQGLSESNDEYRYNKEAYFARLSPGGSPRDAASLGSDGKTIRGDGRGQPFKAKGAYPVSGSAKEVTQSLATASAKRGLARSYGQDLMKGENPNFGQRLTWVAGDRPLEELDDTSRKNLAGGRRAADQRSNLNNAPPRPDWAVGTGTENMAPGTSIFDPVLCELAYRWFCPPEGSILDPFAGGSVRGIVASILGYRYTGIDLSIDQIEANRQQAAQIIPDAEPEWIEGDGLDAIGLAPGQYDFIFSCPPYGDLEVYTNHPRDLSCMDWPEFLDAYRAIIARCVSMLKPDRFACFVVGDFRDGKGFYRNFVGETIRAFLDAGTKLYNEAVLLTAIGSLPIRVGKQFEAGRKLGKTHQNVLVFVKGDPKLATRVMGKEASFG